MQAHPLSRERGGYAFRTLAVALLITACGASTQQAPSQAPLPAVDPASLPRLGLIAVLQAPTSRQGGVYDTVALVRPGGGVVNSATFVPRQPPYSGESAAILPPAAVVAAGSVWILDGSGAVLRLGPTGPAQRVATLPVPVPGAASLAVSPDGTQIYSSAYSLGPSAQSGPAAAPPAPGPIEIRRVRAGGQAELMRTIASPNARPAVSPAAPVETVALVEGWDSIGPVEALHPPIGAHAYVPQGFQSAIANLDPRTGRTLGDATIGGSGCLAVEELASGATLCAGLSTNIPAAPEVRTRLGDLLFAASVPASTRPSPPFSPRLSPDATRVAMALDGVTQSASAGGAAPAAVVGYDGTTVRLAGGCEPVGWAGVAAVVCAPVPSSEAAQGSGPLGLVDLANPQAEQSLGVSGVFVGAL